MFFKLPFLIETQFKEAVVGPIKTRFIIIIVIIIINIIIIVVVFIIFCICLWVTGVFLLFLLHIFYYNILLKGMIRFALTPVEIFKKKTFIH